MRVSYGSRVSDFDGRRATHGARQIARPPYSTLAEAIEAIRADVRADEEKEEPGTTTSEVTLDFGAVLELQRPNIGPYSEGGDQDLPESFKHGWTEESIIDGVRRKSQPTANVDEITTVPDKDARAVVQRAASRGIVAAIEAADGFKYSINNAWAGKDADGQRFSYICQDSMQNKDRHANGYTRTTKHLKSDVERGPRKPTYDCKGSVSIKCSMVRRTIDIYYRHYAIHSSVAERKAMPTPMRSRTQIAASNATGRRDENGGLLGTLQNEKSAFVTPTMPRADSNIGRPLKRKRDDGAPAEAGKPLSLVELLKQSEAADKATPSEKTPPKQASMHPPPMNYDLPSWQKPPPPPPPKPSAGPTAVQIPRASQPSNGPAPYQPPYQPPHSQHVQQQYAQPHQTRTPSYSQPIAPSPSQTSSDHANTPRFATLKATPQSSSPTPLNYYSGRARSSCTNCRHGKKKCDETRPVCGNCARAGKFDCAYDGAYGYPSTVGQQAGMGGWVATLSPASQPTPGGYPRQQYQCQQPPVQGYQQQPQYQHVQQQYQPAGPPPPTQMAGYQKQTQAGAQGQGEREESPDPWFPKR